MTQPEELLRYLYSEIQKGRIKVYGMEKAFPTHEVSRAAVFMSEPTRVARKLAESGRLERFKGDRFRMYGFKGKESLYGLTELGEAEARSLGQQSFGFMGATR